MDVQTMRLIKKICTTSLIDEMMISVCVWKDEKSILYNNAHSRYNSKKCYYLHTLYIYI